MTRAMKVWVTRLVGDERGQDLIEYALLTAGIAFAGLAAWPAIVDALGVAYVQLDTQTQNLWEPPNPGGGP
jgi:Flp pilus assembly pilin Flp